MLATTMRVATTTNPWLVDVIRVDRMGPKAPLAEQPVHAVPTGLRVAERARASAAFGYGWPCGA